jgi:hypothetical protein
MLDFCAEHNLGAEIEVIPAGKINDAYERILASDVRYRFVIDTSTLYAPARTVRGALPWAWGPGDHVPFWRSSRSRKVWVMNSTDLPDDKLTFDECWELLADETLGRIAVIVDDHPEIFPVNFVLDRRSLVFRTAGVTKLWGALTEKPAALEADGYDPHTETAWSVVARGDVEVIEDEQEKAAVDNLNLEPWHPGAKNHYVRLTPRALTGRRFKVTTPDIWKTRLSDRRRASFE